MRFTNCRAVLENSVTECCTVTAENGKTADITAGVVSGAVDLKGLYLAPGFVDIHCHGSDRYWFFENPSEAVSYHLNEGTTSLLCSMWRNAGTYSYEKAIANVIAAAGDHSPIRGIHLEGPYVDESLGSEGGTPYPVCEDEYRRLVKAAGGFIKTWTFDPSKEGAEKFAAFARENGIRLGVCYSKASCETLEKFVPLGLSIGSHIYCATGAPQPRFAGTKEPGSDVFVLVRDDMTAELIADSMCAHVRDYYLKLAYKCKGPDKIALVSDCCPCGDTMGSDINVINGELYGSRLTLSVAVKNMRKYTGADILSLVKMASLTPARAAGISDFCGSVEKGKRADYVIFDDDLNIRGVVFAGEIIRREF